MNELGGRWSSSMNERLLRKTENLKRRFPFEEEVLAGDGGGKSVRARRQKEGKRYQRK